MSGLEDDTIGGFNSMIERQRTAGGEVLVTTVLFDTVMETVHDREAIAGVRPMTRDTYFTRGGTALLDAVGETVGKIGDIHKYARSEDVPEHTVVVITTDGEENSSVRYGADEVKAIVKRQQERFGWEFVFMGANIDAVESAGRIGIAPQRAMNFVPDGAGVRLNFAAASDAICCMQVKGSIDEACFEAVRNDHRNRGTRRR